MNQSLTNSNYGLARSSLLLNSDIISPQKSGFAVISNTANLSKESFLNTKLSDITKRQSGSASHEDRQSINNKENINLLNFKNPAKGHSRNLKLILSQSNSLCESLGKSGTSNSNVIHGTNTLNNDMATLVTPKGFENCPIDYSEMPNKRHILEKLTEELKSHYYLDEFFVDPDKKFLKLLEQLINFFEEDTLLVHLKQNESLYQTFKKKYEDTMTFIKSIDNYPKGIIKENSISPDLPKGRTIRPSTESSNKKTVYFDGLQVPNEFSFCHNESPKSLTNVNCNELINQHKTKPSHEYEGLDLTQALRKDLDKLKDDYIQLLTEKKHLEEQILNQETSKLQLKQTIEDNYHLKNQVADFKEKFERNRFEIQDYQRRLKTMDSDFLRLKQNHEFVKNAVSFSEKEKNSLKAKFNEQNLKYKMLDKDFLKIKKKNSSLNENIKNLNEKLDTEIEEKMRLEEILEEANSEIEDLKAKLLAMPQMKDKDSNLALVKENIIKAIENNLLHCSLSCNMFKDLREEVEGPNFTANIIFMNDVLGIVECIPVYKKESVVIPKLKLDVILHKRENENAKSVRNKNQSISLNISCIPEENHQNTNLASPNFIKNCRYLSTNRSGIGGAHKKNNNSFVDTLRLNTNENMEHAETQEGQSLNLLYSDVSYRSNLSKQEEEQRLESKKISPKACQVLSTLTCDSLNKLNKSSMHIQEKDDCDSFSKDDSRAVQKIATAISETNLKTRFVVSQKPTEHKQQNIQRMLSFIDDAAINSDRGIPGENLNFTRENCITIMGNNSERPALSKTALDLLSKFNVETLKVDQGESFVCYENLKTQKWREVLAYLDTSTMFIPASVLSIDSHAIKEKDYIEENCYSVFKAQNCTNLVERKQNPSTSFYKCKC